MKKKATFKTPNMFTRAEAASFSKNYEIYTWVWPEGERIVEIYYNPAVADQAQILTAIWTAGSFDDFLCWAFEHNMCVKVSIF